LCANKNVFPKDRKFLNRLFTKPDVFIIVFTILINSGDALMIRKILCGLVVFLVAACTTGKNGSFVRYCPNVYLNPVYARMTEMAGKEIQFKAELIGYEGYCRTNSKTGETYAVISPIFEISREAEMVSPEVVFNYYTDTSGNQDKGLGRERHEIVVHVSEAGKKIIYQGEYIEVRIPHNMPGYRIDMGLLLSPSQMDYNRKHGLGVL